MAEATERANRAEEVRQERRRKPGATKLVGTKLTVDESNMDRDKFTYRWARDQGGRMAQLYADDYDPAPEQAVIGNQGEGTVGSKIGGTDEGGKPYNMVLMRKRRDWYEADQKEKQAPLEGVDEAIRRGVHRNDGDEELQSGTYTPGGRNTIG